MSIFGGLFKDKQQEERTAALDACLEHLTRADGSLSIMRELNETLELGDTSALDDVAARIALARRFAATLQAALPSAKGKAPKYDGGLSHLQDMVIAIGDIMAEIGEAHPLEPDTDEPRG